MKKLIVQSLLIASTIVLAEATTETQSAQAVNIKEWHLQFFNTSGDRVGGGNFSYDADRTIVVNSPYDGQLTLTNVVDNFSANFEDGHQFDLYDSPYYIGERWYEPNTESLNSFFNFRKDDNWYFVRESDFANITILQLDSSSNWSMLFDSGTIDSGTWKVASVPEPSILLGVGMALGFGIFFKNHSKNV